MRTGSLDETSALEIFCELTRAAETGLLEVMDGKKKRSFFLAAGDLQYTKSNLKSESAQVLKTQHPDLDNRGLATLQANLRVMNAIGVAEGTWSFTTDSEPPKILSLNLLGALWAALLERLGDEDLLQRLQPHMSDFPQADSAGPYEFTDLPVGAELGAMLHDLDGRRTLEEILDFAPGEEGQALRAVYLSHAVGLTKLGSDGVTTHVKITDDRDEEPQVSTLTIEEAPEDDEPTEDPEEEAGPDAGEEATHQVSLEGSTKPSEDGGGNIGSMIADTLGGESSGPDPKVKRLRSTLHQVDRAENFFEVLGVAWDATDGEYRKAYFELARRYHPDAWVEKPEAQQEMVEAITAKINEAWETLGDAEEREAYVNRVIHGMKTEDELAMEKVTAIFAAEERFRVGLRSLSSGKLLEAHDIFQEIVEAVPEEHEFRAHLGYTIFRLHLGKDEEKAEEGRELIKLSVDAVAKMDKGWVLLGRTYSAENRLDIARKCYIKALKQNPSNPDAHLEMKRIERARGDSGKKGKGKGKGFFKNLFAGGKSKKKNTPKK